MYSKPWWVADAGADIVGVYNNDMPKNQGKIEVKGRKFLGIQADLRSLLPMHGYTLAVDGGWLAR